MAAVAGFSVPPFHCIFTKQLGENISNYVHRVRLESEGRKLQFGAVIIAEIALTAGYDTHMAFSEVFKKRISPSPNLFHQFASNALES